MKDTYSVIKSVGVSPDELSKINTFTTRELTQDEVYVFKAILCDNDLDRDFEHFSTQALEKLKELFVGKTGIFDHNPKTSNQTARIFDTAIEVDSTRKTALGEEYTYLLAKAYMLRNAETEGLIAQIDGGIKKEISVGCSVKSRVCSICNEENGMCTHKAGAEYDGKLCHFTLDDVSDAYEFSFVAVPSQRKAGVIKAFSPEEVFKGLRESDGEVILTKSQVKDVLNEISRLENEVKKGRAYEENLRREVMTQFYLSHPEMPRKVIAKMLLPLDFNALLSLKKGFSDNKNQFAQLYTSKQTVKEDNGEFLI